MAKTMNISGRPIGGGQACFVIAEAGVNHNGDLALAHRLIDAAVDAQVDAIKFQTFKSELLVGPAAPKAKYQMETTARDESQLEMLKRLELSESAHLELMKHCRERNIVFLSTPFEEQSADALVRWGLPLLKLPSGEITNLTFLAHIAKTKVPVVLSTGMASLGEVEQAVEVLRLHGTDDLALLHCVSNYPADPADCNLRAILTLQQAFDVPVGFSDHTAGIEIAIAAVAIGACIIEKHFTLDCGLPGPDHRASLEPAQLADLVSALRRVESSLGDGRKRRRSSEEDTARAARKSIVAACAIPEATVLSPDMLSVRRPGTGLPPPMLNYIVGRRARCPIPEGSLISLEMLT